VADNDDERVERDSDAGEPAAAKISKSSAKSPLSTEEEILVQLKEIRMMLAEAREQQSRYLWILFPIGAILLVQTILEATHF
jgi:hypothetical protein